MNTNVIGDIGEMEVSIRLMESRLFMVFLLGGKVPAFDLLAEILPDENEMPYQFLIQVKTTDELNPYTVGDHRLKTPVPDKKLNALIDRPLPSYVAGVDLNTNDVYIVPAFDRNAGYGGSIPTTFLLRKGNKAANIIQLQRLKDDVINYWRGLNVDAYKPSFNSAL